MCTEQEAASASAQAPLLRAGTNPVPGRSFDADVRRKIALRSVMGHHQDELEEDIEDPPAAGEPRCEKEDVNYRYAPDPEQSCGTCRYFKPEGACAVVVGLIRPVDTCDQWEAMAPAAAGAPEGQGGGEDISASGHPSGVVRARLLAPIDRPEVDAPSALGPVRARLLDATEDHVGFDALSRSLAQKPGIDDPDAVAAVIGRDKYGVAGMAGKSAAGRKGEAWDDDPFDVMDADCDPDEQDPEGRCPDDPDFDPEGWDEGEAAPPGWSGTVKAMKSHGDIDNPFALAWSMKNKGDRPHYPPEKEGTRARLVTREAGPIIEARWVAA